MKALQRSAPIKWSAIGGSGLALMLLSAYITAKQHPENIPLSLALIAGSVLFLCVLDAIWGIGTQVVSFGQVVSNSLFRGVLLGLAYWVGTACCFSQFPESGDKLPLVVIFYAPFVSIFGALVHGIVSGIIYAVKRQRLRKIIPLILASSMILPCTSCGPIQKHQANLCTTNMMSLCFEIRYWNFNGISFPPSLGALAQTNPANLFVCPTSGHVPGSMTNVDEWTDYIYLSGTQMDNIALLDVAMMICPPENHDGKFGHVLWGGGWISRLPADRIRALIKEPWRESTNVRDSYMGGNRTEFDFAEYMRTNTTLHVPARFRGIYPGWHYAYPDGRLPKGHYGRS